MLKILDMMDISADFFNDFRFFNKKTASSEIMPNQKLVEELHKVIIRKFEKQKVHSSFIDNIWGADLADMQLVSKLNKGVCFLLCVIDIYSKYVWIVPLKIKNRYYNC